MGQNEKVSGGNSSSSSFSPLSTPPPPSSNSQLSSSIYLSFTSPPKSKNDSSSLPLRLQYMNQYRQEQSKANKQTSDDFFLLKNPSGHQYSMEQNQLLLTQIHGAITIDGMSESHAVNMIARLSGSYVETIKQLYSHWKSHHTVPSPSSSFMGKGNPSHPLHLPPFSIEIECEIHRLIAEFNHEKGFCNTSDILSSLQSKFDGISITRNGLARRLRSMGYQWGRTKTVGGMSRLS